MVSRSGNRRDHSVGESWKQIAFIADVAWLNLRIFSSFDTLCALRARLVRIAPAFRIITKPTIVYKR